jgi:cyclopropane fatty-acyl-phospholipid synthase-like methyltransferase
MDKLEIASKQVGYATKRRYLVRGQFLFDGITLNDAHVLEVGCGKGAWALWAALHGARKVTGIEPEDNGSTKNVLAKFRQTIEAIGLTSQVEARAEFLHQLAAPEVPYDVVIMYNVINHLDEDAVVNLHQAPNAVARYVDLLKDLRLRMRAGGWVIVGDCGRDNFWLRLGRGSPFVPTIEWHKHQNPDLWVKVFEQSGFQKYDLRWSPLQPIPKLTANAWVQYLTCSHFVLRFRVPDPPAPSEYQAKRFS